MNQLDQQDRQRYWKIDQVKCSASVFAAAAESGFRERFGRLADDKAQGAFAAMGSIFDMTADGLDGVKARLDRARYDRAESRIARRRAGRRRGQTFKAARRAVCRARQFAHSQAGGAGVRLGVRGATPRDPEKLAPFGEVLRRELTELDLSPAARALAAELAAELEALLRELNEAIEEAESARIDERLDHAELKVVRAEVDAELDKTVQFLRTSLALVGHDYLASRVLGKRRGRPRKSGQARRKAKEGVTTALPESEAMLPETAKGVEEFDSAPSEASQDGRKFDPEAGEGFSDARTEPREINEASTEACKAQEEISEGPNVACTAHQEFSEGPCKPCTKLSRNQEIASFQQDTPRRTRRRRRRVAEAVFGASKRLLPSVWRRIGKGEWNRGRETDRDAT